jgi:hypothetical protein
MVPWCNQLITGEAEFDVFILFLNLRQVWAVFSDMTMFLAKQTTRVINHVVPLRPRLLVVELVVNIASVNLGHGHYALSIRTVQRRIGGWLLGQKTRLSGAGLATSILGGRSLLKRC